MSDRIHDSLDDAIDRVAASLVSVDDDPGRVQQIIAALPARDERKWWRLSSLPLQAAAVAVIALAVVYVRSLNPGEVATVEDRRVPSVDQQAPARVPDLLPAAEPPGLQRTTVSIRRPAVSGPVQVQQPFELAAIEAPAQLTVQTLVAVVPLEPLEPAAVAPIAIRDLPLASDSSSSFSKE
jgi:hypothetical protein